jgi:hypothetical protein
MERFRSGVGESHDTACGPQAGTEIAGPADDGPEPNRPNGLTSEDEPVHPVFLDKHGHRRHALRGVAILTGCAVLGAAALLAAALFGAPVGPSALFTGQDLIGPPLSPTSPGADRTGAPNTSSGIATTSSAAPHVVATTTGARTATPAQVAIPTASTATPTTSPIPTTTARVPPGKPSVLPTPPGHTK